MLLGVILGAFGAHALKVRLTVDQLSSWNTGVQYLFIHALGLIVITHIHSVRPFAAHMYAWICVCFIFGIVAFSGSIFLLTTRELHGFDVSFLGPVTPIGGISFIAAWALAAIGSGTAASQTRNIENS